MNLTRQHAALVHRAKDRGGGDLMVRRSAASQLGNEVEADDAPGVPSSEGEDAWCDWHEAHCYRCKRVYIRDRIRQTLCANCREDGQ